MPRTTARSHVDDDDAYQHYIGVRLSTSLHQKLLQRSRDVETSLSTYVRQLLIQAVRAEEVSEGRR
jgi:predicted HicB family RNase H-like nuclease